MILENVSRGTILAEHVLMATTFWRRLIGLIGRRDFPTGCALWIEPCAQVHSLGMAFAIDVVHLARDGTVLSAYTLPRGRIGPYVPGSRVVVELAAGELAASGTEQGDRLVIRAPHAVVR